MRYEWRHCESCETNTPQSQETEYGMFRCVNENRHENVIEKKTRLWMEARERFRAYISGLSTEQLLELGEDFKKNVDYRLKMEENWIHKEKFVSFMDSMISNPSEDSF